MCSVVNQTGGTLLDAIVGQVVLERMGDAADATVGIVSLPLPRDLANRISIDHPSAASHPVGWWVRDEVPRRGLGFVCNATNIPERLALRTSDRVPSRCAQSAPRWSVDTRIT